MTTKPQQEVTICPQSFLSPVSCSSVEQVVLSTSKQFFLCEEWTFSLFPFPKKTNWGNLLDNLVGPSVKILMFRRKVFELRTLDEIIVADFSFGSFVWWLMENVVGVQNKRCKWSSTMTYDYNTKTCREGMKFQKLNKKVWAVLLLDWNLLHFPFLTRITLIHWLSFFLT